MGVFGVSLSGVGAAAFDLSIAQCQVKQVVALGRGSNVDKAEQSAQRACIRKGGTRACCEVQASTDTHQTSRYHSTRKLCLAAVRGPGGVIGVGAGIDKPNAILDAQSACVSNMGKDLPESA